MGTLPKTILGWWAIGLALVNFVFLVLSQVIMGRDPGSNVALTNALTIAATVVAAAALIAGLVSVIKSKERSLLVFVAIAVGLYEVIAGTITLLGSASP